MNLYMINLETNVSPFSVERIEGLSVSRDWIPDWKFCLWCEEIPAVTSLNELLDYLELEDVDYEVAANEMVLVDCLSEYYSLTE